MITIVSALKAEIAPFLVHHTVAEKIAVESASLYRTVQGRHFLRTGVGPQQASRALLIYLQTYQPETIINLGFAGSLNPELTSGDLFSINKVLSPEQAVIQLPALQESNLQCRSLLTVKQAIASKEERSALRERFGADLVDMEAYELAKTAQRFRRPFYCFKMVSDDAGDSAKEQFMNNYRLLADRLFQKVNPMLQMLKRTNTESL